MEADIVKLGNSQGLRIPVSILKQCGFTKKVDLKVEDGNLIVTAVNPVRENWGAAFEQMAKNGDDDLIIPDYPVSDWDDEWQW